VLASVKRLGPALDLFTTERPEWGVTEVARALGMSKSSAHELLMTLDGVGLLRRTEGGRYRLGWRLLSLSRTLVHTNGVRRRAVAVLRDAVARMGETMHLAVYDRGSVIYVERSRPEHSLPLPTAPGVRLPAHPSALGKVLLAQQPEEAVGDFLAGPPLRRYTPTTIVQADALRHELEGVRAEGVAYDREEIIPGLCCVGAPIREASGEVVAAISVSVSAAKFRFRADVYRELILELADEASEPHRGAIS
jgi:IclR family KDG regulon transcriptional repressor